MLGADDGPPEAYAAYAAGRARGGNDADGLFSSARLKYEPAGARRVRECLHPPVVLEATSIEHDALDTGRLRALGQERPHGLRRLHVAAARLPGAELLAPAVGSDQRAAGLVVDDLGVDVVEAPEDGQSRPRLRAPHPPPQAMVALVSWGPTILEDHFAPAFLPTLRRTTSPA